MEHVFQSKIFTPQRLVSQLQTVIRLLKTVRRAVVVSLSVVCKVVSSLTLYTLCV